MNIKNRIVSGAISFLLVIALVFPVFTAPVSAEGKSTPIPPKIAKTYLNVLQAIVERYGICTETTTNETNNSGLAYADLIDFNGDGMDELYLYYIIYSPDYGQTKCIEEVWYFDGHGAENALSREHTSDDSHVGGPTSGSDLCRTSDRKTYLVEAGHYSTGAGNYGYTLHEGITVYGFDGSRISQVSHLVETIGEGKPLRPDTWEIDDKVYYEYELNDNGKRSKDDFVVGNMEDYNDSDIEKFVPASVKDFKNKYSQRKELIQAGSYIFLNWALNDVEGFMESLENTAPSYTYRNVTESLSREDIESIIKESLKHLDGEITAIYELKDGTYYVIFTLTDGNYGGAIVEASYSGGSTTYNVLDSSKTAMTQEGLDAYLSDLNARSNITVDYQVTADFENVSDYTTYLKDIISAADSRVNDAGKSELAAYIENAVSRLSKNTVKAKNNNITINGGVVKKGIRAADKAMAELETSLKNGNVTLNKNINIIIRIDGTNLNLDEPMQITFDESIVKQLGNTNGIILLLGDNQHGIKLYADSLRTLIGQHGALRIQLEKAGAGIYIITFADSSGATIEKLDAPVAFLLPAESELSTVLASYIGGSDNWGGQYDKSNEAIEFSTKFSGQYEVLENEMLISDIDSLPERQQQAIRFMISKGYFVMNGDRFEPDKSLTRYDFTQALVGMFFALDRDLKTSFNDVPEENSYYDYVASAEKDSIVEGYDDQTFKGDLNISKEQVIALCARTLAEKKGYTYPENPDEYLTYTDKEEISEWAKADIALAVREGLVPGTGSLSPKEDINRAESAEMLYKLFMLLYETAPAEFVLSDKESGINTAIPIGVGVVAFGAAGTTLFIKRKKTSKG